MSIKALKKNQINTYNEKYGDIPSDYEGRMNYLLNSLNLKRQKTEVFELISNIAKIKMKRISYVIYLLPKATPRPRSGKNGIFYVQGAKDNRKLFMNFMKNQEFNIITTPTKFYCNAYFPIPSSMNASEKICAELGFIRPISKPDWDNVAKTYCDMCKGFLIYDDNLIIEGISKKYYSVKPRIEITIDYMETFDSSFNQKKMLKNINGKGE